MIDWQVEGFEIPITCRKRKKDRPRLWKRKILRRPEMLWQLKIAIAGLLRITHLGTCHSGGITNGTIPRSHAQHGRR
jgi:hypothetical protein